MSIEKLCEKTKGLVPWPLGKLRFWLHCLHGLLLFGGAISNVVELRQRSVKKGPAGILPGVPPVLSMFDADAETDSRRPCGVGKNFVGILPHCFCVCFVISKTNLPQSHFRQNVLATPFQIIIEQRR